MATTKEIICIQCPLACRVKLHVDDSGVIEKVTDFGCKEGKAYAPQEYQAPKRVLTTTIRTKGGMRPVMPLRSREPIPKDMLMECVRFLSSVEVTAPKSIGDVVISDILGTGVDIICTDDLGPA